jgi:hypothetical protein
MNFAQLPAGLSNNTDTTLASEIDAPTTVNSVPYAVKLIGKLKVNTTQAPPSGAAGSSGVVQFSNGTVVPDIGKVILKQVQCPFTMQVKHAPSSAGDAARKLRIMVAGSEVYWDGNGNFMISEVTPSCTGNVDVEVYGWNGTQGSGVRIFDLNIAQ